MTSLEQLQKQMNTENEAVKAIREKKQTAISQRHQLFSQITENDLVKKEFLNLEPGASVYKLIGPVLVSQDLSDATAVVDKRLEYLNGELQRVDRMIKDYASKEEDIEGKMLSIQRAAQELVKKIQGAESSKK